MAITLPVTLPVTPPATLSSALPSTLAIAPLTDSSSGAFGLLAQAANPASAGLGGAAASTQGGLQRLGLPPQGQVERFQAALGHDDLAGPQDLGSGAAGPVDSAGAADGQGAGQRQGSSHNVGDSILRGLGALSRDLTRVWNDVRGLGGALNAAEPLAARGAEVANAQPNAQANANAHANANASAHGVPGPSEAAGSPRVGDLLAMQRNMVEFSFLFDAVGKGTSKAIEATNQLVKMQ